MHLWERRIVGDGSGRTGRDVDFVAAVIAVSVCCIIVIIIVGAHGFGVAVVLGVVVGDVVFLVVGVPGIAAVFIVVDFHVYRSRTLEFWGGGRVKVIGGIRNVGDYRE